MGTPGEQHHVCMVAYTNYLFDNRVRREAEKLVAHGIGVVCLTAQNGSSPARFVQDGVEVRELRVRKYQGKNALSYIASYCRFLLSSSAACVDLLARGRLDVVHAHNLPDFIVYAGLLPRMAGVKVVLDVHDSVPETFATKFSKHAWLYRLLCLEERWSAALAHRVICVNHLQRDALLQRGIPADKTFVSMNVPDPRIFCASPIADLEDDGSFNLVYHGTMAVRLGVDLIIRAIALLSEHIPCVQLHLWGGGDDLEPFKALAGDLGIGERVHFSAGFRLEELPDRLRSMHLGIVGNRRSAAANLMLPVKLMEYIALGIPAVVPRLPTIDHYLSDDMVTYFEPESVESLASQVLRLYGEPQRRREQARQAHVFLQKYGWERQGAEFVTFYQTLLES